MLAELMQNQGETEQSLFESFGALHATSLIQSLTLKCPNHPSIANFSESLKFLIFFRAEPNYTGPGRAGPGQQTTTTRFSRAKSSVHL